MMKKKIATIIPAAMLVLSLAACGTANTNTPAENPAAETTTVEQEAPAAEADTAETPAAEADTAVAAAETTAETAAAEDGTEVKNGDMTLVVPDQYKDLLIIETPENSEDGVLFEVYEKASVEAAKAQGENFDGAGWLFSIGTDSEENIHEKMCQDMSGEDIFARNEEGTYFVKYHPTDVRVVREQDQYSDENMAQWNELNEWAATVPESFVAANPDLILEEHTNTDLDIYFARIAYKNDVKYTLASLEHGTVEPGDISPEPYASSLVDGASFRYADGVEAPDGEYVVFAVPEDNVRFDFFFAEDGQNIVREVKEMDGESYETIYEATVPEETSTMNEVMNGWYLYLIDNGGTVIDR